MQIRLLGPVEMWNHGVPLDAGTTRQRCVLAALAVDAGRPVLVDTVVDRVWGETPPVRARQTIHVYIARIRKVLAQAGSGAIVRRSTGYVLDLDPGAVDILSFRQLSAEARASDHPPARLALLRQAIELWRGEPLADLTGEWPLARRQHWRQEYLETLDGWAVAEIAAGNPGAPVRHLTALIDQYPLAESLLATLLRALQAAGRSAEALDRYERARKRLAEELGTDPSPDLQSVYRSILAGETRSSPAVPPPVVPAQLPLDVPGFTGRQAQLAELDALVTTPARTVVVAALSGTAGVGKTALSVHWAHRVRHRFPDGQLFVNLRGFGPSDAALDPAEALEGFLAALGVPANRIPADLEARAAAYRSLLADRRVLVVVDNARDADQARPLLPSTPGCLAVVTSRNQLTSLVAIEGARPVPLGLLDSDEAQAMLAGRLGAGRVTAESEAVRVLSTACAGLPIALAIVAAQASGQPDLPLRALADQLTDGESRLDVLDGGDPSSNVRTVFSWSLRAVSEPAERLLRLLGLHPGPATTVAAAASLAGVGTREAAGLLAELIRANLVTEHRPGRYGMHDLLHAYATDLARRADEDESRAALHRMLDHYLHTANHAAHLLHPHMAPITLAAPQPGTTVVPPADAAAALAWFTVEDEVLLGLVRLADRAGHDVHVWQLARSRELFATRQGRWSGLVAVQHLALDAARRLGDHAAEAMVNGGLARAHLWYGDPDEAHRHLQLALSIYEEIDDRIGQARTEHLLTEFFDRRQEHRTAVRHAYRALALYESADDRAGTARALNAVGWCHTCLGEHETAVERCGRALALFQTIGDPDGEAATRGSLGHAYQRLGRFTDAIDQYTRSIDLCRELGERFYEAHTLTHLGDTYRSAGDHVRARATWLQASAIFTDLNHPMADEIRVRLTEAAAGR